jgi:hypothetical protein
MLWGPVKLRSPSKERLPVMLAPPELMVKSLEKVEVAKLEEPLAVRVPLTVKVVPASKVSVPEV